MSINFHAYQCRDYLLSDYEEIEKQWQSAFSAYNPERVMRILNLERDEQYLYVRYFETLYRLCLADGVLEKESSPDKISFGAVAAEEASAEKTQQKSFFIVPNKRFRTD